MLDAGDNLSHFMGPVARAIYGEPNAHLSSKTDLRFGRQGSMHVDLTKGTAYSHEEEIGGGVLWLIEREKHLSGRAAFEFLREIGCNVGQEERKAPPRIVATYDYVDESGDLLFQVVRFEPKKFLQRQPEGAGWSWSVKGVRQVPYRLPDILEAVSNDRPIAIVEGEKDADNLWSIGIPATTNAGGSGKWHAEFAEFFRGAAILILCDNDATGRAHGDAVAQSLIETAAQVRLLDLPNLGPKGDVSDWIKGGGTREEFDALALRAPDWAPRQEPFVSKFGALRWEEIGAPSAAANGVQLGYTWFVEDVFPMGEISLAFGDSGTGKSFSMFDIAMAGARNQKWNGLNVEPGLVVYVAAEAGKGFSKRKIAYTMQHNLEPAEPLPFVLLTKRPNFFQDDTDCLALIEEIRAIKRTYEAPLVNIVVDTLSALAPGMNENASQDVSMVRRRLVMLQDAFPEAAIILVHHKPKNGSTPRGHGSLTADFETTIEYETVRDKKTDRGKTIHRGTVRKQREGKSGITWEFTLPVVEVGRNKWGNPETSCAVQPFSMGTPKPGSVGFHATSTEMLFIRAVYDALDDHPLPPPVGLPKSISKVVEQKHVRALMKERYISPHEESSRADDRFRTAFKRAGDKLRDGGVIGIQGALMWPTGKPVQGLTNPMMEDE